MKSEAARLKVFGNRSKEAKLQQKGMRVARGKGLNLEGPEATTIPL